MAVFKSPCCGYGSFLAGDPEYFDRIWAEWYGVPSGVAADPHGEEDEEEAVLEDDLLLVAPVGEQREHAGPHHDAHLQAETRDFVDCKFFFFFLSC